MYHPFRSGHIRRVSPAVILTLKGGAAERACWRRLERVPALFALSGSTDREIHRHCEVAQRLTASDGRLQERITGDDRFPPSFYNGREVFE